jgi:hypothetical protein
MQRILLLVGALSVLAIGFSCGGSATLGGDTPTEAYKRLYAAVKSKNTDAIKKELTKKTIDFGAMAGARNNTPLEKVYENGFTATTFSETLPNIRDERVNGDMGAIEVWNSKESKWEDLPFIREEGAFKLAIGELFGGTFKSPGKGRDALEREAANAVANGIPLSTPNMNSNTSSAVNSAPPVPSADKNAK